MVFRPELSWEFLSVDEIAAKSVRAVRNHIRHVKETSAYYREVLFDVFPEDIKGLEDIAKLPFTDTATLLEKTSSFIAVSSEQIVETVVTGGLSESSVVFPLTATDLERCAFNEALAFNSAGVTCADRAQMCVSLDGLSFEGLAYYRGLTHLGVNTARVGALSVDAQKQFFDLLKPTVLVGAPSVLKKLALELGKTGFNPESLAVKKIFCTGESIRTEDLQLNGAGKTIEEFFNAKVYSTYGNTELSVSYCECCAQRGGHSRPELVYTEIVDHKGDAVPDGTAGELVATPLGVEGLPLVRYKTGDISFKVAGSCDCGRNSMRIGPILGRTSTIIRMKGTTVYPLSITNVLDEIDGVEDYIIIVEDDEPQSDRVSLHVVTPPSNMENIVNRLRTRLGAAMPVLISNIATIQHYRGKSSKKTRILDNRKLAAQRSRRLSA